MTAALKCKTVSLMVCVLLMPPAATSKTFGSTPSKRDSTVHPTPTMSTSLYPRLLSTMLTKIWTTSSASFMLSTSTRPSPNLKTLFSARCSSNLSSVSSLSTPRLTRSSLLFNSIPKVTLTSCQASTSEVPHQAQPLSTPSQSSQSPLS